MAHCLNICSDLDMRAAYTQATYTMPSHLSILAGILPSTISYIPYYNRFEKQLFRLNNRDNKESNSLIEFPTGTRSIVHGFRNRNYATCCIGAVGWFRSSILTTDFETFIYTGINLGAQLKYALQFLAVESKPFFILLNVGETHDPYEYGKQISENNLSRARMRKGGKLGYIQGDHLKQVAAMSYVDSQLAVLFDRVHSLKRDTIIVVCADHGECFGEDNLYGHGFYHEKVMEVPLGIAFFKGK